MPGTGGWDLFLILDQASSHTARKTRSLAEELRIELAFLPTACPELSPVDLLWRRGKDHVSANRVYPKVQDQAEAFINHLLSFTYRQTLQTTGCLSANFWLPTEYPIGGRRADVWVRIGNRQVAVECQISPISKDALMEKLRDYTRAGVYTLYVLHPGHPPA